MSGATANTIQRYETFADVYADMHRGSDYFPPDYLEKIGSLAGHSNPHVQTVLLFGSYARGEATEHSDIDLAVIHDAGISENTGVNVDVRCAIGDLVLTEVPSYDLVAVPIDMYLAEASKNVWQIVRSIKRDGIVIYERR